MSRNEMVIAGFIVFVVMAVFAIAISNTPTAAECAARAHEMNIPCMRGTIQWDEDECECMSRNNPGVELEFPLPSAGCQAYDD